MLPHGSSHGLDGANTLVVQYRIREFNTHPGPIARTFSQLCSGQFSRMGHEYQPTGSDALQLRNKDRHGWYSVAGTCIIPCITCVISSVRARPKKLISGDCYTISHLISSDLKLISTSYHDFCCCIIFMKKTIINFW